MNQTKNDRKDEIMAAKYFSGYENEKKEWNSNKLDEIQNSLNEEMMKEKMKLKLKMFLQKWNMFLEEEQMLKKIQRVLII